SSIGSLLLTPLNFTFWGNLFLHFYSRNEGYDLVRNLEIDAVSVIKTLLLILALPIFSGMILKSKFPRTMARMVPTIKKLSILIFAAIVIIIFTSNYDFFIKYIFYIFFIVLFHNILAMATGYYSGRLFGLDKKNCKTVSIETGIQNSGLALALLFNPDVFPQDLPLGGMTFIAAWWGVWHIIAGLTIALLWSGFLFRPQKIR
ncbi:MAG: bile acid:sodium symporter family protein, partial [Cyclobacteriaceae bacterium]|nr:bile acid:sodium symporter family protein [Cyclobacteriaceae bacterium]